MSNQETTLKYGNLSLEVESLGLILSLRIVTQ